MSSPTITPRLEARLNELLLDQHRALTVEVRRQDSELYRSVEALNGLVNTMRGLLSLTMPGPLARNDQLRAAPYGLPDLRRCIYGESRLPMKPDTDSVGSTVLQLDPAKLGSIPDALPAPTAPATSPATPAKAEPPAEPCKDVSGTFATQFMPLLDRRGIEMLVSLGLNSDGQSEAKLQTEASMLKTLGRLAKQSAEAFRSAVDKVTVELDYVENRHGFLRVELAKLRALNKLRAQ